MNPLELMKLRQEAINLLRKITAAGPVDVGRGDEYRFNSWQAFHRAHIEVEHLSQTDEVTKSQ